MAGHRAAAAGRRAGSPRRWARATCRCPTPTRVSSRRRCWLPRPDGRRLLAARRGSLRRGTRARVGHRPSSSSPTRSGSSSWARWPSPARRCTVAMGRRAAMRAACAGGTVASASPTTNATARAAWEGLGPARRDPSGPSSPARRPRDPAGATGGRATVENVEPRPGGVDQAAHARGVACAAGRPAAAPGSGRQQPAIGAYRRPARPSNGSSAAFSPISVAPSGRRPGHARSMSAAPGGAADHRHRPDPAVRAADPAWPAPYAGHRAPAARQHAVP